MTAELISVGTELLMGNIVNSNTRFLAEHYGENGAGFYLDGRQYAIWYNAEEIRIAQGESAKSEAKRS